MKGQSGELAKKKKKQTQKAKKLKSRRQARRAVWTNPAQYWARSPVDFGVETKVDRTRHHSRSGTDVMASSPVHILQVLLCVCLLKASSTERTTLLSVSVGDTVTIQCRPRHEPHHDGVYVKTFLFKEKEVSYFFHKGDFTPEPPYTGRLNSNKNMSNFILYINNVTMKDSGIYWCTFNKEDKVSLSMERYLLVVSEPEVVLRGWHGGMVVSTVASLQVKEAECPGGQGSSFETLIIVCVVTASSMVLLIITIILVWGIPKVKRCCENGNYSPTQQPSGSGSTHFHQPLNSEYEVMHVRRPNPSRTLMNPA
ncbi:uncharacterized protein LOC143521911 [Brachyhypopomus gauderio]|uniref:uncharacterized protein LOC143521911 n=1 Tax=Brachyhypopomus gauderio TaxID=698409 RepID=UPI0040424EF5